MQILGASKKHALAARPDRLRRRGGHPQRGPRLRRRLRVLLRALLQRRAAARRAAALLRAAQAAAPRARRRAAQDARCLATWSMATATDGFLGGPQVQQVTRACLEILLNRSIGVSLSTRGSDPRGHAAGAGATGAAGADRRWPRLAVRRVQPRLGAGRSSPCRAAVPGAAAAAGRASASGCASSPSSPSSTTTPSRCESWSRRWSGWA